MEEIYEKAGLFYLGRDVDMQSMQRSMNPTLLKNRELNTHAAIIGMTGSGKTGLGITLIEEAAIDNIPVIVIDPKGDMGNLCLVDPDFRAENFLPWVEREARESDKDPLEYAKERAKTWKEGIMSWDQSPARAARLASVEKSIYTPGSSSGIPIDLVSSIARPSQKIMQDREALASYIKNTVAAILALLDIEADPLESREYILLSQILAKAWSDGESPGLEAIISRIMEPPFRKIGILPLETFYPSKERMRFAARLNALFVSPGFESWMRGESLDMQNLLYDSTGKAKIAIFCISHLSDSQRMFFVTLLLNSFISWMRRSGGSGRLKTMLYMDEIFGYFPPVANPPSKEPMLTLLKQARAFGVGVVLSTQNPVDIDYRGLSNIGTWFIGRLQSSKDIEKVIDALRGRKESAELKKRVKALLAGMPKRTFLMKSASSGDLRLFATRWVLSYLKGPLDAKEIGELMEGRFESEGESQLWQAAQGVGEFLTYPPVVPSAKQLFEEDFAAIGRYRAFLEAETELYFHDARRGIEFTDSATFRLDLHENGTIDWQEAEREDEEFGNLSPVAPVGAKFRPLPDELLRDSGLVRSTLLLKEWLYRNEKLQLFRVRRLRMESELHESEKSFRIRVADVLEEKRELELEKLKKSFSSREERLIERLRRAEAKIEKERSDRSSSIITAGVSLIGALFGGGKTRGIATAINRGSRVLKESSDLSRAQREREAIVEKLDELERELAENIEKVALKYDIDNYEIESFSIRVKKRDISIKKIAVCWRVEL